MEECEKFKEISATHKINLYAVPTLWACSLLHKAYKEKKIADHYGFIRTLRVRKWEFFFLFSLHCVFAGNFKFSFQFRWIK